MTSPHEQAVQEAVERAKWVAEAIERRGGQSSIISISVTRYFAADLRTVLTALEEVTGKLGAAQSQPCAGAQERSPQIQRALDDCWRAVDALGGSYDPTDDRSCGYNDALRDACVEIEKLGGKWS